MTLIDELVKEAYLKGFEDCIYDIRTQGLTGIKERFKTYKERIQSKVK